MLSAECILNTLALKVSVKSQVVQPKLFLSPTCFSNVELQAVPQLESANEKGQEISARRNNIEDGASEEGGDSEHIMQQFLDTIEVDFGHMGTQMIQFMRKYVSFKSANGRVNFLNDCLQQRHDQR